MKKSELVKAVSTKSGIHKKDTDKILNAILDIITEELKKGESISFVGFGSFYTTKRTARETKIPLSDKMAKIPERRVVRFKVGKSLKDAISLD